MNSNLKKYFEWWKRIFWHFESCNYLCYLLRYTWVHLNIVGGSTRDPQILVARPLGSWEDVPGGSRNQKTAGIGGRGTNCLKKNYLFHKFFWGSQWKILYDIKIYSYIFRGEESNGNIYFSNKLYFYTLIGVTPDFLEEFFQVTNQEILGNFKIYSQAFNG